MAKMRERGGGGRAASSLTEQEVRCCKITTVLTARGQSGETHLFHAPPLCQSFLQKANRYNEFRLISEDNDRDEETEG
jgi:hypothetical protein